MNSPPMIQKMQRYTLINTTALSVNTLYRIFQGRILISKRGRRYKKQVTEALQEQRQAKQYQTITEPCSVHIQLRFKSRRRRDLDNTLKPLLDAMEDTGVLENEYLIHRLTISKEQAETDSIELSFICRLVEIFYQCADKMDHQPSLYFKCFSISSQYVACLYHLHRLQRTTSIMIFFLRTLLQSCFL